MSQKQPVKKNQQKKQTKNQKNYDNKHNNQKIKTLQAQQELNKHKISQYFAQAMSYRSNSQIQNYTDIVSDKVQKNLIKGSINLSEEQQNINDFLQFPQKKVTKQEEEHFQKEAKRMQYLRLIEAINKQTTNKPVQQNVPYIFSKSQHQNWINVIMDQKSSRQKKVKQQKQLKEKEQFQKQKKEHQERQLEKIKERQIKRLKIQEKITKQKEEHIHFLSKQIKHKNQSATSEKQLPLYVKMEEKFNNEILMPLLQEKKNQYKNLRQFKSKYCPQKIKSYETQYLSNKSSRIAQSRSTRKFSQWKYEAPAKVQRLQSILEEQLRNNKLKVYQKQRNVQQLQKRQSNFIQNIDKKYKPKIDRVKEEEIKERLIKQKLHLRKVGLQIDHKKLGLDYLKEVKKIPKKLTQANTSSYMTTQQDFVPIKRSMSQVTGINVDKNNQFLAKMRQRKLNKILNSQEDGKRKMQLLKIQAQKLDTQKNMKLQSLKYSQSQTLQRQVANIAMNSIKAKMNMISLLQNK